MRISVEKSEAIVVSRNPVQWLIHLDGRTLKQVEKFDLGIWFMSDDRDRVTQWLHKIMKSNKTLSDLKLRNEFLRSLKQNVQSGKLQCPFNLDPPKAGLKGLARQLPEHNENSTEDDESVAMLRFLPARNGGFLLPKPLPSIGAYVYIAASNQAESVTKTDFD